MPADQIINNLTWAHVDADEKVVKQYNAEEPFKEFDLNDVDNTPSIIENFFETKS